MVPDYHIHTILCKHAQGEMGDYRKVACEKSLPEICFTDHAPNPDEYDSEHRMGMAQFPEYKKIVLSLSDDNPPAVLFGVEADYYENCTCFLEDWLAEQPLDLVIGSVHFIKKWGFDNPNERSVWDSVDVTNTWRIYFQLVERLVDTRLFDVAGHLDLPKKFGYRPSDKDLKEIVQPVLDRIATAKMAVELNTSGLRKPVNEIYPSAMLLGLAYEREIPICFGSDAHLPEEVGYRFEEALNLAKDVGYTHAVRFSGRHQISYPLP